MVHCAVSLKCHLFMSEPARIFVARCTKCPCCVRVLFPTGVFLTSCSRKTLMDSLLLAHKDLLTATIASQDLVEIAAKVLCIADDSFLRLDFKRLENSLQWKALPRAIVRAEESVEPVLQELI